MKRTYCCVMLIKKLVNIRIYFPFGHYEIAVSQQFVGRKVEKKSRRTCVVSNLFIRSYSETTFNYYIARKIRGCDRDNRLLKILFAHHIMFAYDTNSSWEMYIRKKESHGHAANVTVNTNWGAYFFWGGLYTIWSGSVCTL